VTWIETPALILVMKMIWTLIERPAIQQRSLLPELLEGSASTLVAMLTAKPALSPVVTMIWTLIERPLA